MLSLVRYQNAIICILTQSLIRVKLILGLGGGGPLDAAKAGMALVAQKRVDAKFDLGTSPRNRTLKF